jgi:hypothetical protein
MDASLSNPARNIKAKSLVSNNLGKLELAGRLRFLVLVLDIGQTERWSVGVME